MVMYDVQPPAKSQRSYWLLAGFIALLAGVMLITAGNMSAAGPVPAAASPSLPLESWIIQGESTEQVKALVESYGGEVTSELTIIKGAGAMLSAEAAEQLNQMQGVMVTPNHGVVGIQSIGDNMDPEDEVTDVHQTADYTEVTGANQVWEQGVTGDGVTVAVLDTGVTRFKGIKKDTNKELRLVAWKDVIRETKLIKKFGEIPEDATLKPKDPNGHGTHIAGIIANSEKGHDDKNWMGIAPDANLLPVRVLNRKGRGTYESVILGIQYEVENKDEFNVRVMNLSLVSNVQSPYWADPMNQAVSAAWDSGIVVVAAAGNSGSDPLTISVPGNNPYVITVGAFTDNFTPDNWDDDYITPFSGAGPTHDAFIKPDVVASGAHMVSLMKKNSYLAKEYPDNFFGKRYASLAGTSQATAVTSGVVALMLQQHPDLTPDEVKYRIKQSALLWLDEETGYPNYSVWQQGAGRVNAYDAVFGEMVGAANEGLDIQADLAGEEHYIGWSYYDEELEMFMVHNIEDGGFGSWAGNYFAWDGGFGSWAGGFGSWAGGFGSWAGGFGSWAGGFGSWAGGFGSWAGGFGSWAGGFGSWAGGFGSWAGGFGSWAGGFGSWAGGFGSWAGNTDPFASGFGSWAGSYEDPSFLANNAPDARTSPASIGTTFDYAD
ncbi:MAG: S8 family serine peptidase [Chloroflexota bacterium]